MKNRYLWAAVVILAVGITVCLVCLMGDASDEAGQTL
jgi:hypothetical protein